MGEADFVVVGGGIVGLATARALAERAPGRRIVVLEKEPAVAAHQTGRNSGVIHSGVYYRPGSLKATMCREGRAALLDLCRAEQVPFRLSGKVIVATDGRGEAALAELERRGRENGVACERLDGEALRRIEPHVAGIAALHVADAGVVDYGVVAGLLASRLRAAGHDVRTGVRVTGIRPEGGGVRLDTTAGPVRAAWAVGCAGLHADRLARLAGARPEVALVPFRGDYYALRPAAAGLCRTLIYPVPDARFPFLGVHLTRGIGGAVECGPSAVLAFAREGYRASTVRARDLAEALAHPSFRRMARRYWRFGAGEMHRAVSKRAFLRAVQRLVPAVQAEDLVPAASGVRAQAVRPDGTLADDFLFAETPRMTHVLNAPSPAATAALAIGGYVAARVLDAAA